MKRALRNILVAAFSLVLLTVFSTRASASTIWDWSFGSNAGQFVTTGSYTGPGTYSIQDFIVTSSGTGSTLGSWLGGQYAASGFSTSAPYSFAWDGSAVTTWFKTGSNLFNWLVFADLSNSNYFFFGWQTGNVNVAMQAAYYPASTVSSALSIDVASAVPEPATLMLLGAGLALAVTRLRSTQRT
jgi:hypothetical protein